MFILPGIRRVGSDRVWSYLLSTDTCTCLFSQVLEGYGQTECGSICCLQIQYVCNVNIMFIPQVLEGYGQTECGAICCLQIQYVCNVNIMFIIPGIRRVWSDRVWSYLLSTDTVCL